MERRQSFANLLRVCSKKRLIDQGIQVHGAVLKMGLGFDLMLNNDLIDMYAKCRGLGSAHEVFDKMPERNVVSWTALMCGHILYGNPTESFSLFNKMCISGTKPNEFTFSQNLKACTISNFLQTGIQIHAMCVKSGHETRLVVGNSIIDMYSKCGNIKESAKMFDDMPIKNLISWNSMISGFALAGYTIKALITFRKMQEQHESPDEFTLTSISKACSAISAIQEGKQIHGFLITNGFLSLAHSTIAGSLIDLYVKCRNLLDARKVFDRIEDKNIISCSALIISYAQEGDFEESVNLFRQLRKLISEIDEFTLSSIMGVFADLCLVEQGRQIHAYSVKIPSGYKTSVSNSTLDMYLKCGRIEESKKYFDEIDSKNVVSWTVMITGYGNHGLGFDAIGLFEEMENDDITPDDVTYLAILSACSHCGLIKEGEDIFSKMIHSGWIKPRLEHYSCIVDLLGRAGRLKEAKEMIMKMPLKPNEGIWQTLLSACRLHRDVELGQEINQILMEMDRDNPVNYVMMSNIYAEAGFWKEREKVRSLAKDKRLKKEAGCSWVDNE